MNARALLLNLVNAGGTPITLLTHSSAGSGDTNSVTSSPGIDTSGANLLIVAASYYGITGPAISDSKSNSWTGLTLKTSVSLSNIVIYYSIPTTVGAAHTATLTGSFNYPSVAFASFSHAKASSVFDVENGAIGTSTTTQATGSITPNENNELIIAVASTGAGGVGTATHAIDSGMTVIETIAYTPGTFLSVGLAYKVQTSLAAINPIWTFSTSVSDCAVAIGSFKAP